MTGCLAGCQVGPDYKRPPLEQNLSAEWHALSPVPEGGDDAGADPAQWWRLFDDAELLALVEKAVKANYDLARMRERLVEARARRGIVNAGRIPHLDLTGNYTYAETGTEARADNGPGPGREEDVYAAGAMAGWEIDLWGRVAREVEAADAGIEMRHEEWRAAAVSLAAETALTYVRLRAAQERLTVLERNIKLVERTLSLVEERASAGTGNKLDVAQTRRLLERLQATRPALQRQATIARNALDVLAGQAPTNAEMEPGGLPHIPSLPDAGIPADLILNRADVRAAERGYAAAVARIGAAEAEHFPRITLPGSFSFGATEADGLFKQETKVVSFGPGISFPLFSGARIASNVRARKSQAEQARLHLHQVLINAAREVEDAAAGVGYARQRLLHLDRAVKEARRSVRLAEDLHETGVRSLLQMLDVQRELVAVEDDRLRARQAALEEMIRLYRALGGGWRWLEPLGLSPTVRKATGGERPWREAKVLIERIVE